MFTVSELTADIKALLEEQFALIWVTGEISNFRIPASGHYYFTLKDNDAQISGVMFKGQNRSLKFMPEDGMSITGFGRISVYPPRGAYQIILEYLEPAGAGALQAAFEQLKRKLAHEGLFDAATKKPIPYLPARIAIISSPTGAVVHDIIRVIHRRFSGIPIEILPVKVQGDGAIDEIAAALRRVNETTDADVVILARGGGSLEDLAAFNSEIVARAIFQSKIPVISAVGHETDFTIADFAADLRAPTPSAAAEQAVPVKSDLLCALSSLNRRLRARLVQDIREDRRSLEKLVRRLVHPKRRLDDLKLRLDDQSLRLANAAIGITNRQRERLTWRTERLLASAPHQLVLALKDRIARYEQRLQTAVRTGINTRRAHIDATVGRMYALSPAAVLDRGYSITRTIPEHTIVTDPGQVNNGQGLEIIVSKGRITCRVERSRSDG